MNKVNRHDGPDDTSQLVIYRKEVARLRIAYVSLFRQYLDLDDFTRKAVTEREEPNGPWLKER